LERSGFNDEFGDPADAQSDNAEKYGTEFIRELSGILSLAAAIKMDAGYKPANKLLATLKSIEKDPSLILTDGVEPEALASVARNYQRGEEEPGTFWFDVDRPADTPLPDPQRVSKAASMAIRSLEEMARTKSLARKVGRICIDICLYKCLYSKACGGSWNLRVLIGIVATGRNARNTDSRVPRLRVCLTGRS
jgi:hypothetical protein